MLGMLAMQTQLPHVGAGVEDEMGFPMCVRAGKHVCPERTVTNMYLFIIYYSASP